MRVRYIGVHAPLAIHAYHSLTPFQICPPHAHTCACVHIRIYSQCHLHSCTFADTQHYSLPPTYHSKSTYISYSNTWHTRGTMHCVSIEHAVIIIFIWPELQQTSLRSTSLTRTLDPNISFGEQIFIDKNIPIRSTQTLVSYLGSLKKMLCVCVYSSSRWFCVSSLGFSKFWDALRFF